MSGGVGRESVTEAASAGRWQGHVWAARLLQGFIVVAPIASGVGVSYLLARLLPAPDSNVMRLSEVVAVALIGLMTMRLAMFVTHRLLPLSTLLGLTLAFPDSTPSRVRVAMRVTSESKLRELAEQTRVHGLPTEPSLAAERVLELVAALSYHDRITRGHAERVRAFCGLIAGEMGFDAGERDHLQWAGLLHDIGKLGIPPKILNKPGRLTDEEFEVIKTHPAAGEQMLEPLRGWLGDAVDAAGQHHERWDGRGYPRGMTGESIVMSARIVAVADVFDVITSTRSYKEPSTAADARAEIARCAGSQFDERVVRAFLGVPLTRLRRTMGPLTLLAQLPVLSAIPGVAGSVGATVGALSTAAMLAVTTAVAVPPTTIDPLSRLVNAGAVIAQSSHDLSLAFTPGGDESATGAAPTTTIVVDHGESASVTFDDGTVVALPEGSTIATLPDGTSVVSLPSGEVVTLPHGSEVTTTDTSGTTTTTVLGSDPTTTTPATGTTTTTGTTLPVTTTSIPVSTTLPVTTTSLPVSTTLPVTTTSLPVSTTLPVTTTSLTVPITTTTVTVPKITTTTLTVPITTTTLTVPITTTTITVPKITTTTTITVPTITTTTTITVPTTLPHLP